jgi:hypothetical protein
MKTIPTLLVSVGLLVSAAAMHAAEKTEKSDAKPSPVSVAFFQPEKFMDVRDGMMGSDKGRDAILEELRRFITTRAEPLLPPGHTLSLTFLDVDLAGDYEFWRGPNMQDVRIVKDIYPPRFLFRFVIKDDAGKVLKEGERRLTDLGFMQRLTIDRQDPLRYEKDLLGDWLRSELRRKR